MQGAGDDRPVGSRAARPRPPRSQGGGPIAVASARARAYVAGMAHGRFSPGKGPTQRQLRVGELIRRRLAEVLARGEVHDSDLSALSITVGEVRVSPDLKVATAFVMPLGGNGIDTALAALARNQGELRHLIGGALATKYTPQLRFRADETFDRIDATRRMFADPTVQRDIAAPDPDDPDGPSDRTDGAG